MSTEIQGWFNGRLPDGWFTGPVEVTVDREEITVIGTLPAPETATPAPETATPAPEDSSAEPQDTEGSQATESADAAASAAAEGRIKRFREETRGKRVEIAREAERKYGRKVAWGVRCGRSRRASRGSPHGSA